MGGYSGGQGNSLQNSSAASAKSGDIGTTTGTGNKTVNFNAPAKSLTDSTFGKFAVGGVLVVACIGALIWLRKKR